MAANGAWQKLIVPTLKITISNGQDLLTQTQPWFSNSDMTFRSGPETLWQFCVAEESREVTAAGFEASGRCPGRSQFAPQDWEMLAAGVCFLSFFLFFSHKSLLSSPFSVPQPCLFSGLYGGVRDVWGMVMTSKCSPPSPWSFGVLKPLLFLTGCPELWRPLFCSAESSSLFTSVMFPLYPPPYI